MRGTVSRPLRRALALRDHGCQFPGCANDRWLDAHHVEHWVDGGETSLENLLTLCRRHHVFVHERGFAIEKREDELVFRDPDGRVVPNTGEIGLARILSGERLHAAMERQGISITPATNQPRWDGDAPDYGACLTAMSCAAGTAHHVL